MQTNFTRRKFQNLKLIEFQGKAMERTRNRRKELIYEKSIEPKLLFLKCCPN